MTVIDEVLVDAGPEMKGSDEFLVPELYREAVLSYAANFDTQFSPEANNSNPMDKEMHPVRIGRHRCEVVKYRDYDGKVVRSLEIAKGEGATRHLRKATAVSITEDELGQLRADIEVFRFYEKADGDRLIISGKKEVLGPSDYKFLRAATPLIGIKLR